MVLPAFRKGCILAIHESSADVCGEDAVMSKVNAVGLAGMVVVLVAGLGGCNRTGSLQVYLTPAAAVDAGAQWAVDGGTWQNSGVTVSNLSEGIHPVTFKEIAGWTTPVVQNALIAANETQVLNADYVMSGEGEGEGEGEGDPRGIYVYTWDIAIRYTPTDAEAQDLITALNVAGVDGIALVEGWKDIEPTMGHYQWEFKNPCPFDQWISKAASLHMKIMLAIRAGKDTPCWLFDGTHCDATDLAAGHAGATPYTFYVAPHEGLGDVPCRLVTIATPWDPIFLDRWNAMLAAVAQHLEDTGSYDAVKEVRLTGINRTTDEFRLPAEILSPSDSCGCISNSTDCHGNPLCNSVATWQQAGFTPSNLFEAWKQITAAFQASFGDKFFNVAIIPPGIGAGQYPFPPIDDNGCVYSPGPVPACDVTGRVNHDPYPDPNAPLLQWASQMFPGHFAVAFDNLEAGQPANDAVVQACQTLGTMAGFQTNNYFGQEGGGCACSGSFIDPGACTSATYFAVLQQGIYPRLPANELRSQYLEVFWPDVLAFPDAIWQAHLELTQPSPTPIKPSPSLTFNPGSTERLEQLIGDTDVWTRDWPDPEPTPSQSATRFNVVGCELGSSFEHTFKERTSSTGPVQSVEKVVFLFGDALEFRAFDIMGWSSGTEADAATGSLQLNFFTGTSPSPLLPTEPQNLDGTYTLLVNPTFPPRVLPPQGISLDMGAFDIPYSGISVGGIMYVTCRLNHTTPSTGPNTYTSDASILTRFDDATGTFSYVREISRLPGGKFLQTSLQKLSFSPTAAVPPQEWVAIWGSGTYRQSDVYFATVPASDFESGEGTIYFAGLDHDGAPTWSGSEAQAKAVATNGTTGDFSVAFLKQADLWIMMYDDRTLGSQGQVVKDGIIQFRYSKTPWGPWSDPPQTIFTKDQGYGTFIRTPPALVGSSADDSHDDGIDSPVTGSTDLAQVGGGAFAPMIVQRFTRVSGKQLRVYYTLSTWVPYYVVLMRSDFTISP